MSVKVLNVNPDTLKQARDGINGVIDGLGGYGGQMGRGFSDLSLTGEQISHPDAKSAYDNYLDRWEWGTRALIVKANDIGEALDLGAGRYELQEEYYNNALKDMANDLVGDPSLQKEQIDKMSWGALVGHNVNQLTNPDWSAESFQNVAKPALEQSWNSIQENAGQATRNLIIPGEAIQSTVDGFTAPEQKPTEPSHPAP
ncbi:hypothetical protein EB75_19580 [Mycobacterium sp. ST-F2]|uniref:hypothetical protein n=1 Tax=Mycobacterium sp. ST-F2 TaxID=1490484 RepID=UPI0009395019|nr:hypothetical protein [Mycobacterium sp. ST-F2]OKH85574.1 hypothetical protein EB75_19580 [Mycobacterium sp. ST-F2]